MRLQYFQQEFPRNDPLKPVSAESPEHVILNSSTISDKTLAQARKVRFLSFDARSNAEGRQRHVCPLAA